MRCPKCKHITPGDQSLFLDECPSCWVGCVSVLMPVIGLIAGLLYLIRGRPEDIRIGRQALLCGLLGFVIGWLVWTLWLNGSYGP